MTTIKMISLVGLCFIGIAEIEYHQYTHYSMVPINEIKTIATDTIYQQCPRCGYNEMLILHNNPIILSKNMKHKK